VNVRAKGTSRSGANLKVNATSSKVNAMGLVNGALDFNFADSAFRDKL
jgi:hypothetical protein